MKKSEKFLGIFLAGVLILILILLILPNTFEPNSAFQEQFWTEQTEKVQHQRQLWNAQKITKYKLKIGFILYDCVQEVIIESNHTPQIIKDCLDSRLMTISQLFNQIETVLGMHACGPNGCDCDGPYIIEAVYDEKYHFPKSGKPTYASQESWRYQKTNILRLPNLLGDRKYCTMLSGLPWSESWEVVSFTPMK